MGLSWDETKVILKTVYGQQRQQQRLKQEQQAINSIVFVSNKVTQRWRSTNHLDESVRLLKHLQRNEYQGNIIHSTNEDFSLVATARRIKKDKEIVSQIDLSMNDLVASKNEKNKYVYFLDKNTGDKLFRDDGEKIVMRNRKPELNHTAAALTLASEKDGVVKITGTKAFKEQVIDVAMSKDLNIVFSDKAMEAEFVRHKYELKQAAMSTLDTSKSKKEDASTNNKPLVDDGTKGIEPRKFKVDYGISEEVGKLAVNINGSKPNTMSKELLEQIAKNDRFLRHYSVDEIRSGLLDRKKAQMNQPVPKTYEVRGGEVIEVATKKASHRGAHRN
jgi:hypothetical protein